MLVKVGFKKDMVEKSTPCFGCSTVVFRAGLAFGKVSAITAEVAP